LSFLVGVVVLAACTPAPVPAGYIFPTRDIGGAAPAALLEGVLEERAGCLLVRRDDGVAMVPVWPNELRLVLDGDGRPVVMRGAEVYVAPGDRVALGGGEPPTPSAELEGRCGVPAWETSELVAPP
jgi:hypothetical protein